ncbi:MAG: hypothetical protein KDA21_13400 [Phycisphaerales bacterium]|nr:hypothetical protein [Phycisphaerales bacterium]
MTIAQRHRARMMALIVAGAGVGVAGADAPIGGYTVGDVVTEYNRLAHHPDPISINIGVGQDANLCKHYQGLCRYDAADGTPYFFISRSGHHGSAACFIAQCSFDCSDDPGELLVARLGSRPRHGERLRSNLLSPDQSFGSTPPPAEDVVVTSIVFDGTGGFPGWMHLGGMQLVDDVLVIPMEREWQGSSDIGSLLFLDVSAPASPVVVNEVIFPERMGVVAITRDPSFGHYLIAFTGGDSQTINWYETIGTDLKDPMLQLVYVDTWNVGGTADPNVIDRWEKWQTMNFVRQTDGTLFMAMTDNTDPEDDDDGKHWSRLFRVTRNVNNFDFVYEAEQKLKLDDPRMGNAAAAGGFHVTPSGQLILYTGEHDNGGPDDCIRCGEVRSYNVSTTGVDPSSDTWIELYNDDTGWNDNANPDKSLMLDLIDVASENWWDLDDEDGWGDEPDSLRFRAPAGQQVLLFKDQNLNGAVLRLTGDGSVQSISRLDDYGFGDSIHSVFAGMLTTPPGTLLNVYLPILTQFRASLNYQGQMGVTLTSGTYLILSELAGPTGDAWVIRPAPNSTVEITTFP